MIYIVLGHLRGRHRGAVLNHIMLNFRNARGAGGGPGWGRGRRVCGDRGSFPIAV